MEIERIKQILLSNNWIENTEGNTYRFVNEKEVIIKGVMGHLYELEDNGGEISIVFNPQTNYEKFTLIIIDPEKLRLFNKKLDFILTAN